MSLPTRVAAAWNEFWFTDGDPVNLAVARILLALTSLWIMLSRDLPALLELPAAFWSTVARSFQWRYLLFPGHSAIERTLFWLAIVLLVAVLFGVYARQCAFLSALLLYHFAPLESFQWSSGAFTWSLLVLGLFFIAASPSGWALALRRDHNAPQPAEWQFHWSVQMLRLQLCLLYFFSAYSKMWHTGLGWAAPGHMQVWVLGFYQREQPVFTSFAPWLADHPWLCGGMGLAAQALEFGFPLALFFKWPRRFIVTSVLLMHLGIVFALNITVFYWPLLFVFFDWSWIPHRDSNRD